MSDTINSMLSSIENVFQCDCSAIAEEVADIEAELDKYRRLWKFEQAEHSLVQEKLNAEYKCAEEQKQLAKTWKSTAVRMAAAVYRTAKCDSVPYFTAHDLLKKFGAPKEDCE